MFLDKLQSVGYICNHPNEKFRVLFKEDGDRILTCQECDRSISLKYYFCHLVSPKECLRKVEEYVQWRGDDSVPCRLDTSHLRNRAPTDSILTNYSIVTEGCLLLRILHQPFTQQRDRFEATPAGNRFLQKCIETGLDRLIGECENKNFSTQSVGLVCRSALLFLKDLTAIEAKRYFTVLVPYVKGAASKNTLPFYSPLAAEDDNPTLQQQLQASDYIHRVYSKYCASFDAVHVAALCFLCQDDLDLACDLVLDFAFKIGRGYYDNGFSWPAESAPKSLERQVRELFVRHVSPHTNTPIHRLQETCQAGGTQLEESFSDGFFATCWDLKSDILHNTRQEHLDHLEWVFPRVLFQDYSDYYAFLAASAHYSVEAKLESKSINDLVIGAVRTPQEVVSNCRTIFRFAKYCLAKMKAFHELFVEYQLQRREPPDSGEDIFKFKEFKVKSDYYLSRDMLKRLFDYDTELEKKLMDSSEWWTTLPIYKTNDPDLKRKPFDYKYVHFALNKDAEKERFPSEVVGPNKIFISQEDKWNYYMKKC